MDEFFNQVRALINAGDVRISEHGYDELANDALTVREVLNGINEVIVIEAYPTYPKGARALFLQNDKLGLPIHVVWGIPKGYDKPVVLVTAYRPDSERWDKSFTRRQS